MSTSNVSIDNSIETYIHIVYKADDIVYISLLIVYDLFLI